MSNNDWWNMTPNNIAQKAVTVKASTIKPPEINMELHSIFEEPSKVMESIINETFINIEQENADSFIIKIQNKSNLSILHDKFTDAITKLAKASKLNKVKLTSIIFVECVIDIYSIITIFQHFAGHLLIMLSECAYDTKIVSDIPSIEHNVDISLYFLNNSNILDAIFFFQNNIFEKISKTISLTYNLNINEVFQMLDIVDMDIINSIEFEKITILNIKELKDLKIVKELNLNGEKINKYINILHYKRIIIDDKIKKNILNILILLRKIRKQSNSESEKIFYDRFTQYYTDSLVYEYKLVPEKTARASFYINSIIENIFNIEKILNSYTKLFENNNVSNFKNNFINDNINCVLRYKNNINPIHVQKTIANGSKSKHANYEFPKDYNVLMYHGAPSVKMHKLPDNCLLCILTPLNRYGIGHHRELFSFAPYDGLLNNPMCYARNTYNDLFTDCNIYFGGQYYYDLSLSAEVTKKTHPLYNNWGIYTNQTKTHDRTLPDTTLSKIIDKKNLKGIIIVSCCRSIDTARSISVNESILMYRYEHMLKNLNKSVFFENYEDFRECDRIIIYDNKIKLHSSKAKDSRWIGTEYHFKGKINTKDANNSTSVSADFFRRLSIPDRIVELCNSVTSNESSYKDIYKEILLALIEYVEKDKLQLDQDKAQLDIIREKLEEEKTKLEKSKQKLLKEKAELDKKRKNLVKQLKKMS